MDRRTMDKGLAVEVDVMNTLKSEGWHVKYHPSVRSGSIVYQPDIIAEKDGQLIGLECKVGLATISDVAVIGSIRADERLIVATGPANDKVASQAEKLNVKILTIDNLVDQLRHGIDKRSDTLGKFRSRIGFFLMKEHEAEEANQYIG